MNLCQLNYQSDLYSSNVLRQAVRRLPIKLHGKWAEHCLKLRQKTEPNLIHLKSWLQEIFLAMKEAHMLNYPETNKQKVLEKRKQYKRDVVQEQKWSGTTSTSKRTCIIKCNKPTHTFFKCVQFRQLTPQERFEFVRKNKLCYNCSNKDHFTSKCPSLSSCFQINCQERHHTSLHDYFVGERKRKENQTKDTTHVGTTFNVSEFVYLQIVPINVKGKNGKSVTTYALLDNAAQSTYFNVPGTYR